MAELYNHYYKKLIFSAWIDGQNMENAEDIASNVMASIFENAKNYKYIEKPNAYMYQAVRFEIINFKKKNAKYAYTESMDDIFPIKDNNVVLQIEFKNYMNNLSERHRRVVEVHYVYGFKIEKTAEILNVSVSTINRDIDFLKGDLKKFF